MTINKDSEIWKNLPTDKQEWIEKIDVESDGFIYRNKEVLEFLYLELKYSLIKIGKIFNKSQTGIRRYMRKFNIKVRSSVEAQIINSGKTMEDINFSFRNKDWLYEQYINKKLSSIKIAEICNIHRSVILDYLNRFSINRRNKIENKLISLGIDPINVDFSFENRNWLYNQYINKKKSMAEIGRICGVGYGVIHKRLIKFNIKRRESSDAKFGKKSINRNFRRRKWLERKYLEEKLSPNEIADLCNVSNVTIFNHLIKNNIPIRDLSEVKTGNPNHIYSNKKLVFEFLNSGVHKKEDLYVKFPELTRTYLNNVFNMWKKEKEQELKQQINQNEELMKIIDEDVF